MKLKNTRIQEILSVLQEPDSVSFLSALEHYHQSDIATALTMVDPTVRKVVYQHLDTDQVAGIFTYFDHVSQYIEELPIPLVLTLMENMDADDALSILDELDDSSFKETLLANMDKSVFNDIRFIAGFPEDEVGHMMSTNFVTVNVNDSIKEAMKSVIAQAKDNDNINTIFVLDKTVYHGIITLKDLIIARDTMRIDDILIQSHPKVYVTDKIEKVIEQLKDYGEDCIPVLNHTDTLVGVITLDDILDAFDEEMGDDYAKLAGLSSEEDLQEPMKESIKKRLPWLVLLLGLGLIVSSVVGVFEGIVAQVSVIILFQSLILDMAGNVGTQSLAVTIRVLMDEQISGKVKRKLMLKETRIGAINGILLGGLAFIVVLFYLLVMKQYLWIHAVRIAVCVSLSLLLAMMTSAFVGTAIPIFFHKIKIDPAVASGPLITTVNDLIAVITYYGLAGFMLLHMGL